MIGVMEKYIYCGCVLNWNETSWNTIMFFRMAMLFILDFNKTNMVIQK